MINIDIALDIPDHNGAPANLIYELPNMIGARQDVNNAATLCSINGLSLPYITLEGCYVNGIEIPRVYIEALGTIQCISNCLSNFITVVGIEQFEIIAASVALPGMTPIENRGVYANRDKIYRAYLENPNCLALLKKDFLSNGFRFKALGNWYKIVNDVTIMETRQPDQQYQPDKVYGFVIDSQNNVYPVNEVGTIY